MAFSTRSRVTGSTHAVWLMTRDTVAVDTPAMDATSFIVAMLSSYLFV